MPIRPEKNHPAQLRALCELLEKFPEYRSGSITTHKRLSTSSSGGSSPLLKHRQLSLPWRSRDIGPLRLVLLGSVRNAEDEARVLELKALAKELGIQVRLLVPWCLGHLFLSAVYIRTTWSSC